MAEAFNVKVVADENLTLQQGAEDFPLRKVSVGKISNENTNFSVNSNENPGVISKDQTETGVTTSLMKCSMKTGRISRFGHASRFTSTLKDNLTDKISDENNASLNGTPCRSPLQAVLPRQIFPFPCLEIKGITYYELSLLGKGATAQVFKVVDAQGNIYALKKVNMKAGLSEDLRLLADVNKELEVMAKCRQFQFVVQLISEEFNAAQSMHYILMEYGELDAGQLIENNLIDLSHWIQVPRISKSFRSFFNSF